MHSDDQQYNAEIQALAQAEGLCHSCGGLHILNVEIAILARVAELPWCLCDGCQVCSPFRRELDSVMERSNLFGSGLA